MQTNISTMLREIKTATSWSEPKIAEEMAVSQPTVNRILNGQENCDSKTLLALQSLHARVCPAQVAAP